VDYPFSVDTRTQEEKIWAKVEFELNRCANDEDNYDTDKFVYKIPIDQLVRQLESMGATKEILHKLLRQHNKLVENDFVIIEDDNDSGSNEDRLEEEPESLNVPVSEPEDWDT